MGTIQLLMILKIKKMTVARGIFNTINSIQILTQVFENNGNLNMLENFMSINGALHYEP